MPNLCTDSFKVDTGANFLAQKVVGAYLRARFSAIKKMAANKTALAQKPTMLRMGELLLSTKTCQ